MNDFDRDDRVPGRNAVLELLRSGRAVDKIYLQSGEAEGSAKQIVALARVKNVPVLRVPKHKLDEMYDGNHQGVVAQTAAAHYAEVEDMLAAARERGEAPFLLMLAELDSPHNLGAILRTAEVAGVHGVIIARHNSVGLNSTVHKVSAGASEYVPVARVTNLVQTAKALKEEGLWVYGADMDGADMWQEKLTGPLLLVVGGEDRGIPRLLREECDVTVRIPMRGHLNSLNASVAAGVLIYEITRQRQG